MHNPLQNTMSRWDWIRDCPSKSHGTRGKHRNHFTDFSRVWAPSTSGQPARLSARGRMLGGGGAPPGGTGPTGGGAPAPGPGGAMVPAMPGSMSQMPGGDGWDGWGLAGDWGPSTVFFLGGRFFFIGDTIFEQE